MLNPLQRHWQIVVEQRQIGVTLAGGRGVAQPRFARSGDRVALVRAIALTRPLLVLARDTGVDHRLAVLQAGADDVVDANVDPREIIARLTSLLRRHRLATGRIACADLAIDVIDRRVPRGTLLRAVWRIDFDPGTNRVEVHMSRLRAKIDHGFVWPMLFNRRGQGYGIRSRPDAPVAEGRLTIGF